MRAVSLYDFEMQKIVTVRWLCLEQQYSLLTGTQSKARMISNGIWIEIDSKCDKLESSNQMRHCRSKFVEQKFHLFHFLEIGRQLGP